MCFTPDNAVKIRLSHLNNQATLSDVTVIFEVVVFHRNLWEFMGENGKNMEIMGSFTQAVFILSNEIEEKQ